MLKVVIIGYGEMFTNIIAGVLDSNSKIVGVLRHNRIKYSKLKCWIKDILNPDKDYNYVKSYKLPEINVKTVNSEKFKRKLLKLNPDIMIVASWSEKIKKEIYDIPKIATINVHPSLLPKYRGPNPYMHTILNLEKKSGVTFHLVDKDWDTGAILDQRNVDILQSDTGKELKTKTALKARGAICELLEKLSEDVVFPVQQNNEKASYYSTEFEHEISFMETSEKISAQIRCIHPWSNTYFYVNDYVFIPNPYKISIIDNSTKYTKPGCIIDTNPEENSLTIVCGDNKLIKFTDLKLSSKLSFLLIKHTIKKINIGDLAG